MIAHWAPAGNLSYLTDAQNFYQLHLNEESGDDGELLTDWDNVYWASNVLLANLTNTGAYHTAVQVRGSPPGCKKLALLKPCIGGALAACCFLRCTLIKKRIFGLHQKIFCRSRNAIKQKRAGSEKECHVQML